MVLKVKSPMRLLLFLVFTFITLPSSFAQKKQISEARTQIKSKSNLDKAEKSMRALLKDSANRNNIKIYVTLAEAVKARYEAANEQFYLKQKSDTSALFTTARTMFQVYELLDSTEMRLAENGKGKLKLRKKNSTGLAVYRPNLYSGGLYFIKKGAYADAFAMLDTYLQCAYQPLFTSQHYTLTDSLSQSSAFWTVYCGLKMNNPTAALRYKDIALTGKEYRQRTLECLSEVFLLQKDTVQYIETLSKGFNENPSSPFFFTRIMDYYNDRGAFDTALKIADKAVTSNPGNTLFLFGKSNALLNLGRYEDCLKVCDTLLANIDTVPDVYFNAGASYVNMALQLEKDIKPDKKKRNRITAYYKMALPYMEKFRQLAPEEQDRWAPPLYNIYLKLNMGQQFEEINDLLRKAGK